MVSSDRAAAMKIVLALAMMVSLVWLYLIVGRGFFWRAGQRDVAYADRSIPAVWPAVIAVVPARDEAELIGCTMKPLARNPKRVDITELFVTPPENVRRWPKGSHQRWPWAQFFGLVDAVLRRVEPYFPSRSRKRAIAAAVAFVNERLNGDDGLGAIFPAMANTVMTDDLGTRADVETDRRLIEEEETWPVKQGASNLDATHLPAGKFADLVSAAIQQFESYKQFARSTQSVCLGDAVKRRMISEILHDRQIEIEGARLKHDAKMAQRLAGGT